MDPAPRHIRVEDSEGIAVASFLSERVAWYGEAAAQELRDELFRFIERGPGIALAIDLGNLAPAPAQIEGLLLTLHREVRKAGGTLRLRNLRPEVADQFRVNRLDRILEFDPPLRRPAPRRTEAEPMPQPSTTEVEPRDLPYDCLVISDLHLGSDVCQAKLLEEFLEWAVLNTRELVINGDIFDDLNFKRLSKRHFACLKVIRRNSDRADFRLIWMRGNHDGPADIVSHIVGVEILDEYIYRNDRIKLLILHGDQFDTFITQYKWLTEVACGIFYYIQKWAPHRAARAIRRVTKKWQRNSQLVMQRAVEHAKARDCRFVTCGHTHLPLVAEVDGVRYLNSGTWIEHPPCPFVAVKGAEVALEFWPLASAEPVPAVPAPEAGAVEGRAEQPATT